MVKVKKIHKNISLSENVMNEALKQAEKLFSGNFSMYLTYLINKDIGIIKENNFITLGATPVSEVPKEAPKEVHKETPKEVINNNFIPLTDIDDILNN